jgi:hypothetical protein
MLVCASIIAQPIESSGYKNFLSTIMPGNYAGFAQSVGVVVDFFARPALAGSWHAGLVSASSFRERPPGATGRRVSLDRLQPITATLTARLTWDLITSNAQKRHRPEPASIARPAARARTGQATRRQPFPDRRIGQTSLTRIAPKWFGFPSSARARQTRPLQARVF